MKSLAGQLLVAIPDLCDPNFFQSVVLMLNHDDSGACGIILNRPSNVSVGQVWDQVADVECDCSEVVHVGGPVEGPLIGLHTSLALAERSVMPGVFLTTDRDQLNQLVTQDKHAFRIYSGYAGWGPGQLDAEVDQGGWLVHPAEYDHVFHTDYDNIWKSLCQDVGNEIMLSQFLKQRQPGDPNLN